MPGRPRIPTWLLAGASLLAIGAAAWLFFGTGGDPKPSHPAPKHDASSTNDESSLRLPTDTTGTTTGDGRREPEGQTRLDAGADGTTTTTETNPPADADVSAALDTLRDATISIEPTWTLATASTKHVALGGQSVRCTPPAATGSRRPSVATALAGIVDAAGGTSKTIGPSPNQCADVRAAVREASDAGVVFAWHAGATRVLPALPGAGTTKVDHAATLQLATEIANAVGAPTPSAAVSAADRALLLDVGLVDLPGGSTSVLVLTAEGVDGASTDLPRQVALGIGLTLAAQRD